MSDFLDRGARVLVEAAHLDTHAECRAAFANAVAAAFDPADEALVHVIANTHTDYQTARKIVEALYEYVAQGGQRA